MKLCISAPPHIDTSALAQKLAGEAKASVIADPTPALIKAYGFQTLYDMPRELQTSQRRRLIEEHLQALSSNSGSALFEHGVFPWIADWMRWHWGHVPAEAWEEILTLGRRCAEKYDKIIHVSEGPAKGYDGYAWLDPRNGRQIDTLLKHLYADFGVTQRVEFLKA